MKSSGPFGSVVLVCILAVFSLPLWFGAGIASGQTTISEKLRAINAEIEPHVASIERFIDSVDNCDSHDDFWAHVYNPARLLVQKDCVAVTGVIVDATAGKRRDGLRHEADGDCHGWLRLDSGQAEYLNAGNKSNEGGNLVFEVICKFPVTQADALSACKNYSSPVKIPAVGTHVRMSGTWVIDNKHARWMEIHPVFSIIITQ